MIAIKKICLCVLLSLSLMSCTIHPNAGNLNGFSLSELALTLKTQAACEAHQGAWEKLGTLQKYSCVLHARDAGKICSDGSDCQIACEMSPGEFPPAGSKVKGQCQASTNRFGCRVYITHGIADAARCID